MNCVGIHLLLSIAFYSMSEAVIVHPDWKIYYDLRTNNTIESISSTNPRLKIYRQYAKYLRIGFGPIPCSCQDMTCGCCAGMNIQMFNFNQRACMNFTYDPDEFAINMNMYMNDNPLYNNSISGKNPPPVCLPVPIPYIPSVDFCARFFNIHTTGNNVFVCLDFETRMERAPLLVLHFDCLQMGQDGISHHKPDETDSSLEELPPQQEDEQIIEVYDEVVEDSTNGTSGGEKAENMSSRTEKYFDMEDGFKGGETLATTALPTTSTLLAESNLNTTNGNK